MATAILANALASTAFLATHLALSSEPIRGKLVGRLGEFGFMGFYSLVALATFGAMIAAYGQADDPVYLWLPDPRLNHAALVLMPLSLIFVAGGYILRNPSAVGMEGSLDRADVVQGLLRVTRHPVMWGVMLWAAAHILANGDVASVLFFGGFLLTALLGSLHLDRRMAVSQGERWERFSAATSHLPFAAILSGRQTLRPRELILPVAIGLLAFGAFSHFHVDLFGVPAY